MSDYYPVKRPGQRRRLNPNWPAIRLLEAKAEPVTALYRTEVKTSDGERYALLLCPGASAARRQGQHPRPMFEVFEDGASSTMRVHNERPCPVCNDFAYAGRRCGVHVAADESPLRTFWLRRPSPGM